MTLNIVSVDTPSSQKIKTDKDLCVGKKNYFLQLLKRRELLFLLSGLVVSLLAMTMSNNKSAHVTPIWQAAG